MMTMTTTMMMDAASQKRQSTKHGRINRSNRIASRSVSCLLIVFFFYSLLWPAVFSVCLRAIRNPILKRMLAQPHTSPNLLATPLSLDDCWRQKDVPSININTRDTRAFLPRSRFHVSAWLAVPAASFATSLLLVHCCSWLVDDRPDHQSFSHSFIH